MYNRFTSSCEELTLTKKNFTKTIIVCSETTNLYCFVSRKVYTTVLFKKTVLLLVWNLVYLRIFTSVFLQ